MTTWEHFDSVDYEVNGRTIKVAEWRKELEDGTAIIRMGYLRIDNCPRYQIVVLFRGIRILADQPPFRKFDDALEAANAWLPTRAKQPPRQSRRLSATPQTAEALALPPPAQGDMFDAPPKAVKTTDGRRVRWEEDQKRERLTPRQFDKVVRQEYYKLDHGRTSLHQLKDAVIERIGYQVSLAAIAKRTGNGEGLLPMMEDRKAALLVARPLVKAKFLAIIKANPDFGFTKASVAINRTALRGYKSKWLEPLYYEARKEYGFTVKGNVWQDNNLRR
ncbi:MAG: hypothetical protein K0U66_07435 [Gammaproteobacteria bacterium]|nr:hypothetical protein [Gammaproteobacteria bacterium]